MQAVYSETVIDHMRNPRNVGRIPNADGEASITGKAKRAVFHTDTENAELSGDVYGYSAADQVGFYAQNLVWLKDERVLKSTGLETVRIKKDDGSYIQGVYFTIDARRKSLTFDAAVRGRYFHDNTNND